MTDRDTTVVSIFRVPSVAVCENSVSDVEFARSLPLRATCPVTTEQGKLHSVLLSVSERRRRRGDGETKLNREGSRPPLPRSSPLPSTTPEPSSRREEYEKENYSKVKPFCSDLLHLSRYSRISADAELPRAVADGEIVQMPPCSNLRNPPPHYDGITTSTDVEIHRTVSAVSLTSSGSGDTAALCPAAAAETAATNDSCRRRGYNERRKKSGGKLRRIRKRFGKERI